MAFLDNSGDIILDAVLTDTGRLRLAQGDGSFKITKFALGDDEINYDLYNKNHASGSSYFDLEVLQTPVLEAFTNNSATVKTKLVTMSRTNILYMPILKLNENTVTAPVNAQQGLGSKRFQRFNAGPLPGGVGAPLNSAADKVDNRFYIAVDKDTYKALANYRRDGFTTDGGDAKRVTGLIQGFNADTGQSAEVPLGGGLIRVDQGLDTSEVAPGIGLDSDLIETAFIVELDYRLGRVKRPDTDGLTPLNFVDDDSIATYYVTHTSYINPKGAPSETNGIDKPSISDLGDSRPQVFDGPRGNTLQFRIHASQELQQSTYLFNQLGFAQDADAIPNIGGFPTNTVTDSEITGKNIYYLDSTVRVVGANTGYRLDIPVRYVKIAT